MRQPAAMNNDQMFDYHHRAASLNDSLNNCHNVHENAQINPISNSHNVVGHAHSCSLMLDQNPGQSHNHNCLDNYQIHNKNYNHENITETNYTDNINTNKNHSTNSPATAAAVLNENQPNFDDDFNPQKLHNNQQQSSIDCYEFSEIARCCIDDKTSAPSEHDHNQINDVSADPVIDDGNYSIVGCANSTVDGSVDGCYALCDSFTQVRQIFKKIGDLDSDTKVNEKTASQQKLLLNDDQVDHEFCTLNSVSVAKASTHANKINESGIRSNKSGELVELNEISVLNETDRLNENDTRAPTLQSVACSDSYLSICSCGNDLENGLVDDDEDSENDLNNNDDVDDNDKLKEEDFFQNISNVKNNSVNIDNLSDNYSHSIYYSDICDQNINSRSLNSIKSDSEYTRGRPTDESHCIKTFVEDKNLAKTRVNSNFIDMDKEKNFNSQTSNDEKLSVSKGAKLPSLDEMRSRAHELCGQFLGGPWNDIEASEMQFIPITGGLSNFLYLCALPASLHSESSKRACQNPACKLRTKSKHDNYQLYQSAKIAKIPEPQTNFEYCPSSCMLTPPSCKISSNVENFQSANSNNENEIMDEAFALDKLRNSKSWHTFVDHRRIPSRVLVRLYGPMAGEDMSQESVIFMLLSERKLGPRLYGVFRGGRLEEYLPAPPLTEIQMKQPDISEAISRKLASVHSLEVPISKRPDWLFTRLEEWSTWVHDKITPEWIEANLRQQNPHWYATALELLKIDFKSELKWMRSIIEACPSPLVFCHNDLLNNNILMHPYSKRRQTLDERLVFIDFEYCSYNYRGFDLANHFCEWAMTYTKGSFEGDYDNFPSIDEQKRFVRAYLLRARKLEQENSSYISLPVSSDQFDAHSDPTNSKQDLEQNNVQKDNSNEDLELIVERVVKYEIATYCQASHLVWGLWSIQLACSSTIEFDYWRMAKTRLKFYQMAKEEYQRNISILASI